MKVYVAQDNYPCKPIVYPRKPIRNEELETWYMDGERLSAEEYCKFERMTAEYRSRLENIQPLWEDEPVEVELDE